MKKILSFAFVGAIALAGATMVSCSSDDSVAADVNPTYDGNSVKTEFTISLPGNVVGTRMSAAVTQEAQTLAAFRGMDNIKLIPFSSAIAGTTTKSGSIISLGAITNGELTAGNNSKVYTDKTVPVGTTNFLFYAKALDNTAEEAITTAADKFKFGSLVIANLTDAGYTKVSDVTISHEPIVTATTACAGSTVGAELITLLNAVAGAEGWANVTEAENKSLYDLFTNFKTLTTGSTWSVKSVLEDLYTSLNDMASSTTNNGYAVATAIRTAITTGVNSHANTYNTTTNELTLNAAYTGSNAYPADVNLPDGAARVTWSDGQFNDATSMNYNGTFNVAKLTDYVYPANLQYFVNSPLEAAGVKMTNASNVYTQSTWPEVVAAYQAAAGYSTSVLSSSRSIAITKPIQYAVGRLETQVKLASTPSETIKYYDKKGEEVTIPENGFKLTGVLIGNQKAANWDYTQNTAAAAYTIYDQAINGDIYAKNATAAGTNYTLALQTKDDEAVYVALEFSNEGGEDFQGADGIIPAGGKFYLVGVLEPSSTDANYGEGEGKTKSVFKQDFTTKATFTIKPGSETPTTPEGFGTATNGIPDLRTPQLELGLSVDLTWQAGLTFNIEL